MVNKRKSAFVCKNCQSVGGTSNNGLCRVCYSKEYYKNHRDEIIKKSIEWVKNNPEKSRAAKRASAKRRWSSLTKEEKLKIVRNQEKARSPEQRERRREKSREYYKNNKHKIKSKKTYKKPCIICGKKDESARYIGEKCKSCYSKEKYKALHPITIKNCIDCGGVLRKYTKREKCRNCITRDRYADNVEYREKIKERNRTNNKKDGAKFKKRMAVIRRRSKIESLEFSLTKKEWEDILNTFHNCCAYCGQKVRLEMDHVIPVSKGGPTTKDNIVPCCRSCNSKKGNKIGYLIPKNF